MPGVDRAILRDVQHGETREIAVAAYPELLGAGENCDAAVSVPPGPTIRCSTIVGVVGDVRHDGLHAPAALQVYMPHAQAIYPEPMMVVVVRMAGDGDPSWVAGAARAALRELDPFQPITQVPSGSVSECS
jgi:hypothetical protein